MPLRNRFLLAIVGILIYPWLAPSESAFAGQPPQQLPARHDTYGDPLPDQTLLRLGTVRLRHPSGVNSLVFSPDGKLLASAGLDRTIRLWDPASGNEIRRFVGHDSTVCSICFSPDSQRLVSGSWDRTVRLWDVRSGKELRRYVEINAPLLAFSPDGNTLVAALSEIELWDAATGIKHWTIKDSGNNGKDILSLAYTPDGKTLAVGHDKGIQLLDPVNRRNGLALSDTRTVSLFFSPDCKTLISGHVEFVQPPKGTPPQFRSGFYQGNVRLRDAVGGNEIKSWPWPATGYSRLAISPDGKQLAGGAEDGIILIWDSATGETLKRLEGCGDRAGCLTFSPDGKTLAAETGGPAIHLWDLPSGKKLNKSPHQRIPSLAVSPTNQLLATTDGGREVLLWELPSGSLLSTLTAPQGVAFCIGFTPDGQILLWGSKYHGKGNPLTTIHVWSVADAKRILTWQSAESIDKVSLSPDGRWLASTGAALRLWDLQTGKEYNVLKELERKVPIAFSSDSKILAAAFPDVLRWWDVESGKEIGSLEMNWNRSAENLSLLFSAPNSAFVGDLYKTRLYDLTENDKVLTLDSAGKGFRSISLAPDAKTLATSSPFEDILQVWNVHAEKLLRQFELKGLKPAGHQFLPDCRSLMVYGETVCLVETATGKVRHRFEGLAGRVESAKISAGGKYLITANGDATVLVWDLIQPFSGEQHRPAVVGPKELAEYWADLKADDAGQAYRTVKLMALAGEGTLTFLKERLKPFVPADSDGIAKLIAGLDNQSYKVRENASKELEELGILAEPALRYALKCSPSLEMRRRIERVLQYKADWLQYSDNLRSLRALEVVELIGTPEAQEFLRALSNGAPFARLTIEAKGALARLELQR